MRKLLISTAVAAMAAFGLAPADAALDEPIVADDGFTVEHIGTFPGPVTGVAVSPVDGMLYATVVDDFQLTSAVTGVEPPVDGVGGIYRLRPLPDGSNVTEPVMTDGKVPLGLTFDLEADGDGTISLYFTDLDLGPLFGHGYGAVKAIDIAPDGSATEPRDVLVGLPVGVHQTNHLEWGPDGLLYVSNGSTTDSGWHDEPSYPIGDSLPIALAQPAEQHPLTGSILRFDPDVTDVQPDGRREVLFANRYRGNGFAEQPLEVVATGMRNNYGMTFVDDDLYVTFNGPNPMHYRDTVGDDLLLVADDATGRAYHEGTMIDFGWPGCLYETDALGWPRARTPERADKLAAQGFVVCEDGAGGPDAAPIDRAAPGKVGPIATFGPHASADGITVGPDAWGPAYAGDLFVALYGRGSGVAQVELDGAGHVAVNPDGTPAIREFAAMDGVIDVIFADGVLYLVRFAEGTFGPGTIWTVTPTGTGGGDGDLDAPSVDPTNPPDAAAVVVAGPGSNSDGFTTPDVVMARGTQARFAVADVQEHNVVAHASGPDTNPWCDDAKTGAGWADDGGCPLFASDTAIAGEFPVAGSESLDPGTYTFFCSIHGDAMSGTLTVL